jgi:hypothetical protein
MRAFGEPAMGIIRYRGVAQSGSALRSGRKGRRFESSHPDQSIIGLALLG